MHGSESDSSNKGWNDALEFQQDLARRHLRLRPESVQLPSCGWVPRRENAACRPCRFGDGTTC